MNRYWKRALIIASVAVLTVVGQFCLSPMAALAQKSGTRTTNPTRFSVIELPALGRAVQVTNADASGNVIVAGDETEGAYGTAAAAKVNVLKKTVVSLLLPEPTDGMAPDAGSSAADVNQLGVIVGGADVFEGAIDNNHRVSKPCRWLPAGDGYQYQLLPLLNGDNWGGVMSINDSNWMVGNSSTTTSGEAVIWPPAGDQVYSLESALPANSGWSQVWPDEINNRNEIVGGGMFNGVQAGFVMTVNPTFDSDNKLWILNATIASVNLPTGAVKVIPASISDAGAIVGSAYYADGSAFGTLEDAMGLVSVLPSATTGDCHAYQSNLQNQIVGVSWVPEAGRVLGSEISQHVMGACRRRRLHGDIARNADPEQTRMETRMVLQHQ